MGLVHKFWNTFSTIPWATKRGHCKYLTSRQTEPVHTCAILVDLRTHLRPLLFTLPQVESVVIMGSVCLLFVAFMIPTGFVLYKWHGVVFIALYVAYLAFAIGQVYL